jgi:hypothetical protein
MGRAIDMENNIEKHEKRIFKLEGAVEEMIQLVENIRVNFEKIQASQNKEHNKRSTDVKKKANNKGTKSKGSGK